MPRLWSQESNIRVIGQEHQGQDIKRKMDITFWEKLNRFLILNLQAMENWIHKYEEAKRQRLQERASFRRSRTM